MLIQVLADLVPQVQHVLVQVLALSGEQGDGPVGETTRLGRTIRRCFYSSV